MIMPTDILLAAAFFYGDFKSMQLKNMVCCVLCIDTNKSKNFTQFNVEGVPQPKTRRSLIACAKSILELARTLIDKVVQDPKEIEKIKSSRAEIPQIIECTKQFALSYGVIFEPDNEFIASTHLNQTKDFIGKFGVAIRVLGIANTFCILLCIRGTAFI
jgi:hypothetical protein